MRVWGRCWDAGAGEHGHRQAQDCSKQISCVHNYITFRSSQGADLGLLQGGGGGKGEAARAGGELRRTEEGRVAKRRKTWRLEQEVNFIRSYTETQLADFLMPEDILTAPGNLTNLD